jgi:ankyrin repeat protein
VLIWLLKELLLNALQPDNLGRTATHIAANMCSLHAFQSLHECRQLCFDPAEDGATPLHIAARLDCIDAVKLLLAAGHPTYVADSQGSSPLHVAAMEQSVTVLNLLVLHGNIDRHDSDGASPLMICVGKGLLEVVESLLKSGANAAHRNYSGRSCLHIMLLQLPHEQTHQFILQHKIAVMLLKYGIDVNARDIYGCTPCHIAAKAGNIQMLKYFMDNGGDVTITDLSGRSCLVQLNRENFHYVTQILIDRIKIPSSSDQEVLPSLCISTATIIMSFQLTLHSLRSQAHLRAVVEDGQLVYVKNFVMITDIFLRHQ